MKTLRELLQEVEGRSKVQNIRNEIRNTEMIKEGLPVDSPLTMREMRFTGDQKQPYINTVTEIPTSVWTEKSDRSWGGLKDIKIRDRYPSRAMKQSPLLNMFRKVFGYNLNR